MLKNEIIKILSNKSFLVLLVVALLFNGGLIYWQQLQTDQYSGITYKEYSQLNEDIESMPDTEKQVYISEKISELRLVGMFEQYLVVPDILEGAFTDEELQRIEAIYRAGDYIKYTSNIGSETELYQEVLSEVQEVISYPTVLESVKKNSKRILRRLEEGTFEYERAEKSIDVYDKLEAVEPYHQPSRGVNLFFDNVTTDLLVVICILYGTVIAITYEREKNLLILSKTTKHGRTKHALIKIATLTIIGVVVVILLYGETLLVAEGIYGLGDLSRPIQSVTGYSLCALGVSVGTYIGIYVALKFMFFIMCVAMFFLVSCIFRRAIAVYMVTAAIVTVLIGGYNAIPDTSYLHALKTFNPVSFGQVEQILSRYQCVEVFGHAYDKLTVYAICMVLVMSVLFVCGTYIYAVSNEKEIVRFEGLGISKRISYHVGMFRHEFYKSFVAYRIGVIHIVGLIVAYMVFMPASQAHYDNSNVYYDMYSSNVEGEYTEDVDKYIENQIAHVEEKLEEYSDNPSGNQYLSFELAHRALEDMKKYTGYLDTKDGSYYLNNDGYLALSGAITNLDTQNILLAVLSALFTIVCVTSSISADYERGEDKLIHSTMYGRTRYGLYKSIIGIVSVLIIYISFWLCQLVSILGEFGTDYFQAPAYSIEQLHWLPGWVSIGMYIVSIYVMRFVALLVIMMITSYMVKKLRSNAMSILIAIGIFVGPVVLYFLGVEAMKYLTLFWL